ncbi:diacylglycerol O-acyltransferase [Mycobacterium florentinum]|uniref:Diacylglycerol O-acyltransferase n=1 Tax=Mycobacterium florentinum TaxID=292462 RepID=A0A1X1UG53_MYCFL|nr:wax ester/triacylglycerol synthase family O-acyltransferase [Mycobacterium florentinum]MCV7413101.1 wax ester/triacylglycerol synthase family O-acyltransferase [Mycobacterium florentinum]ORV55787.1 diacylglycerol O-acyltransferase [Mycobacterium florentinum]BBX76623.1 diacylglycerol O-acyltransferase [Mycobacterium florentinum]
MATNPVRLNPHDAGRLRSELSAVDHLMLRGEANPRLRSGFISVEILDNQPDWDRFRARAEDVSRRVLRPRQKVVVPVLPTAAPRWVIDPEFNIEFHVRRVRVPGPGTLRELFDMAEVMLQSPFDIARPLWTATLVEGLTDGRAAALLHLSHAVVDGVGSVKMFAPIYDLERNPPAEPTPPQPVPQDLSAKELMREGVARLPGVFASGVRGALSTIGRAARDPAATVTGVVGYARSSARILQPAAGPSPLLRSRGVATRTEALDMELHDLDQAAKACDGSINEVYLAGLCAVLRRYHCAFGTAISTLPMVVPVNLRTEDDPTGGNKFAAVGLAAPVGAPDPAERIHQIRAQMTRRREEPAKGLIGAVAPALSMLPTPVLVQLMLRSAAASDVLATNIPLYSQDTYLCGAKVLRQYGFGPMNGTAVEFALVSRGGMCTITARYDRAAVQRERLFAQCLLEGFNEVLALAGEPAPCAVPASFSARDPTSSTRLVAMRDRPRGIPAGQS